MSDLPYDEAMKKREEEEGENIRKLNNALNVTGNVAKLTGKHYVELVAQGMPHEAALEITKEYHRILVERAM